jgi:perosamine synthetase
MDEIMNIADRFDLKVIEDSAESIGSKYKNKRVGTMGDCGVFSFHGTKMASSGEGGMFITNNKELFEKFNILHDQGRIPNEEKFFFPHKIGYKYKISNLQAALAYAQIERLEELVNKKIQIFNWYKKSLEDLNFIGMNIQQEYVKNCYWMPTIVFNESVNINRDDLMKYLDKKGIDSRPFFYPLSSLPMFKKQENNNISYSLSKRGMYLPSAFHMSKEDVGYVVECIKNFLEKK